MIGALNPAVRRLAWRQLRHHRSRTLALFVLTVVPLTVSVMLGIGVTSSELPSGESGNYLRGELGDDPFLIDENGRATASQSNLAIVESWRQALPGAKIETWPIVRGRLGQTELSVWSVPQNWPADDGSFASEVFGIEEGRRPAVGELAMSGRAMAELDLELGDTFPWVDGDRPVVAKLATDHWHYWIGLPEEEFAAAAEGLERLWFAIDLGPHSYEEAIYVVGDSSATHFYFTDVVDESIAVVSSSVTSLGSMVVVSLIAAAAWASGVRRRLRDAGLAVLNGAERRHVVSIILVQALAISVAGGLLAIEIAVMLSLALKSNFPALYNGNEVTLNPFVVGLPLIIGVGASLLAAWWPAWRASRLPVGATLAGRLPAATFRNAIVLPLPGLAAGVVGLGGMSWLATDTEVSSSMEAALWGGLFLLLIMACLGSCIPLVLTVVSRAVGRRSSILRLVTRDSVRNPLRAALATAALIAVFAGPMLMLLDSADQAAVNEQGTTNTSFASEVDTVRPTSALINHPSRSVRQELADEMIDRGLVVGSVEAAYSDAALDFGRLLIPESSSDEAVEALYEAGALAGPHLLVEVNDSRFEEAAKDPFQQATVLVLNPANNDDDLRALAGYDLVDVDSRGQPVGAVTPERVVVGLVLFATLVITGAMTIITAAEAEPDLRTIVAIGAPASLRRTYLSLQALYQSGLAMILGVAGAVALHMVTANSTGPLELPINPETAFVLSIPVLSAAAVWLLTRPLSTTVAAHG